MFRLDRTDKPTGIYLTIEGELKSESVEAAESACLEVLSGNDRVTVVVRNVTEIDSDGYAFLKRLVRTKAHVHAIGIYSEYILRSLKNSTH